MPGIIDENECDDDCMRGIVEALGLDSDEVISIGFDEQARTSSITVYMSVNVNCDDISASQVRSFFEENIIVDGAGEEGDGITEQDIDCS